MITKIKERISKEGYINISDFMEIALTSKEGYYSTQKPFGEEGDFITAPEISAMFGEIIGIWIVSTWINIGQPTPFHLMELGPGRGKLIQDILRATKHIKGFHEAIKLEFVELSDNLKNIQEEALSSYLHIEKRWHKTLDPLVLHHPVIIIANEFFDALPINQYIKINGIWKEIVIRLLSKLAHDREVEGAYGAQNRNVFDIHEDSSTGATQELPAGVEVQKKSIKGNDQLEFANKEINLEKQNYLTQTYSNACENGIIEESEASNYIIKTLEQIFLKNTGSALIIDYGYDISLRDPKDYISTLQAVKKHKYSNILEDVGCSDISSHVNFKELKKTSLKAFGSLTQREFLINSGILYRFGGLKNSENVELLTKQLHRLIDPKEMGCLFRALALADKDYNLLGFKEKI